MEFIQQINEIVNITDPRFEKENFQTTVFTTRAEYEKIMLNHEKISEITKSKLLTWPVGMPFEMEDGYIIHFRIGV